MISFQLSAVSDQLFRMMGFCGYAARCAEKLCFSGRSRKYSLAATPPVGRHSLPFLINIALGKAELFRTWSGKAARWLAAITLAILYTLNFLSTISAQPTTGPPPLNSHRWGSISVFNGLPSDSVRAIAQTPDGVLWFGTDNGLARLDGRGVQKISLGDDASNRILALLVDPARGELLIGTSKGGYVYSRGKAQRIAGTEDLAITAIDGNVLATDAGKLLFVEGADARPINQEAASGADGKPLVFTSIAHGNGRFFVGTLGRGILEYTEGGFKPLLVQGLSPNVNSIVGDRNILWIGAEAPKGQSGIYRYDLETSKGVRVTGQTSVVSIVSNTSQGVYAGTLRYGLFRINELRTDNSTFENTSGGMRSNTVFSIFADREGVVWFGTNRGVSRYDDESPFQDPVSDVPNRNFIRNLWHSNNELFAGSNRGLFMIGDVLAADHVWKPIPSLSEKAIYAIEPTQSDLIVGTTEGVFDLKGKKLLDGETRSLASFHGRTFAAVFGKGVVEIGTGGVIFPEATANSLHSAGELLWIGTAGKGLFSYNGTTVKPEGSPDELKSGTIWNIREAEDKSIWLAAEHGVFRVAPGQVERIIAAEEVRDVLVEHDRVWAATTTKGVLQTRKDERFGWLVSTIGFEQGLPSDKAFSIAHVGDRILFATNRGIVTYYPHYNAPRLMIARILSERQHSETEFGEPIKLEYPQNSLLVEVAGLSSRTFPEEFQYAFTLKNSKGEVVSSRLNSDPQFSGTDLPAGDYTIEAIAFDRDLNASDPVNVRFSVGRAPFPWTATALGVLLALALIGLIWAIVEHRRMKKRNKELAAARLDLANEAERERSRIARDLHDQTLADLRNLMMMSDKLPVESSEFRNEIEAVSGEIRRICEDLSPSVLENVGLIAALDFLLSRTIDHHKLTAPDDLEDRIDFPVAVQLQIYRIAQEVLNNIKAHSDATEVEMRVDIDPQGRFELMILDNGQPFDPTKATPKGRGITNIKARASLINARIAWRERKNGNRFTLQK